MHLGFAAPGMQVVVLALHIRVCMSSAHNSCCKGCCALLSAMFAEEPVTDDTDDTG